jgi:hypothetical protein
MDFSEILAMIQKAVLIAYVAVGIIEWVKAGIEMWQKPEKPLASIIAWCGLPAACFGAACLFDGGIFDILSRAGVAWATAQLGYPLIVKLPAEIIGLLKAKISSTEKETT